MIKKLNWTKIRIACAVLMTVGIATANIITSQAAISIPADKATVTTWNEKNSKGKISFEMDGERVTFDADDFDLLYYICR